MKKFLALVLALVMTMSLVTISAGAEFTDADDMNYAEAVEVMTAAGVVSGYADGSFNPQAGLTRGAAAKIICNMILGPTTAEALAADAAPYSDVATDNVFAGYIAYCAKEGIISGYADGTFRPAAPLTGYAFMKMLLGALGYDADVEGYTGANWSINVAKRALNIGLDADLVTDFVGAKALTREEACLYAFNTMKATMVDYGTKTSISVGDITVSTSAEAREVTTGNTDNLPATIAPVTTLQFAEKYFSKLKVGSETEDAYGRPAHEWVYNKESVGVYADTPVVVYTAQVENKDVVEDLKDAGYKAAVAQGYVGANPLAETDKYMDGTGAGILTEIYGKELADGTDVIYETVQIVTNIGQISNIVKDKASTKDDDRAFTIDGVGTVKFVDEQIANFDEIYSEIEKEDWVLYTLNTENKIETVIIPETLTGVVSKVASGKATIDGEVYTIAAVGSVAVNTDEQTIWLDTYGNVIKGELVDNSSDVVYYVDSFEATDKFGDKTNYVRVVTAEGEVVELEAATPATASKLYTYTTDSEGVSTLTPAEDVSYYNGSIKATDAKMNGSYWADGVVFVYIDGTKADLKVSTADGVQKVTGMMRYALNEDGEITVVFVDGKVGAAAAEDLLFAADVVADGKASDLKGNTCDAYEIYIAGVKDTQIVTGLTADAALYTYSINAETGKYEAVAEEYAAFGAMTDATIAQNKYISVGSYADYVLADDCAVYDLTDNGMTTLAEIETLYEEDTMTLYVAVAVDTEDEVVNTLYVWAV